MCKRRAFFAQECATINHIYTAIYLGGKLGPLSVDVEIVYKCLTRAIAFTSRGAVKWRALRGIIIEERKMCVTGRAAR